MSEPVSGVTLIEKILIPGAITVPADKRRFENGHYRLTGIAVSKAAALDPALSKALPGYAAALVRFLLALEQNDRLVRQVPEESPLFGRLPDGVLTGFAAAELLRTGGILFEMCSDGSRLLKAAPGLEDALPFEYLAQAVADCSPGVPVKAAGRTENGRTESLGGGLSVTFDFPREEDLSASAASKEAVARHNVLRTLESVKSIMDRIGEHEERRTLPLFPENAYVSTAYYRLRVPEGYRAARDASTGAWMLWRENADNPAEFEASTECLFDLGCSADGSENAFSENYMKNRYTLRKFFREGERYRLFEVRLVAFQDERIEDLRAFADALFGAVLY